MFLTKKKKQTCNSNQKWNNEACQRKSKNYHKYKTNYSWNPSKCICENDKYFKRIVD